LNNIEVSKGFLSYFAKTNLLKSHTGQTISESGLNDGQISVEVQGGCLRETQGRFVFTNKTEEVCVF
jgi:hypothetical protein